MGHALTSAAAPDAREIWRWLEAALALPRPDPELVAVALGARLSLEETRGAWRYLGASGATGPIASVRVIYNATLGQGRIVLQVRNSLAWHELDCSTRWGLPELMLNPSHPPDGITHYRYWIQDDTRFVTLTTRGSDLLQVTLGWEPRPIPYGQEAVFKTAPAAVYLRNYDTVANVLTYGVHDRSARVLPRAEFAALGSELTNGAFVQEDDMIVGVFATPAGPAFFSQYGKKRVLGRFGVVTTTRMPTPSGRFRFTLFVAGRHFFDVLYRERHGLGANPYDNEPADIDLFAWLVEATKTEDFFVRFTRPWIG